MSQGNLILEPKNGLFQSVFLSGFFDKNSRFFEVIFEKNESWIEIKLL